MGVLTFGLFGLLGDIDRMGLAVDVGVVLWDEMKKNIYRINII
jgi:hypothetical protein